MRSHTLGLGIAALASIGVAAGQPDLAHIDGAAEAAVDAWRVGEVDAARLLAEDAAAGFGPERFAETHDTLISPADSGTLTDNGDGTLRWRLRLESADGLSVNFGSLFDVPPSTVMTLRDGDGRSPYRPMTAADAGPTGELWSPLVPGPVMEIDITVAADDWDAFRAGFWITHVNLGYRPMGGAWARDQLGRSERSGGDRGVFATDSCLVDILCPLGDPWRPVHAKGVALYTLQGNLRCSGAMVMGSEIMPDSERLTRSTSLAWRRMSRFLWITPSPPFWAMQIAASCSVTVSMAADSSGIDSSISGVSCVLRSTSRGRTSDGPGTRTTSSKVSPSLIPLAWLAFIFGVTPNRRRHRLAPKITSLPCAAQGAASRDECCVAALHADGPPGSLPVVQLDEATPVPAHARAARRSKAQ